MPFCPKCRYEYNVGVQTCADCDEPLVDSLQPDEPSLASGYAMHGDSSDVEFVPLPDLPGKIYAEMVKGALEEKDIPCYIQGRHAGGVLRVSGTGPPASSVRLFVPKNRYEECVEIQQQMVDQ